MKSIANSRQKNYRKFVRPVHDWKELPVIRNFVVETKKDRATTWSRAAARLLHLPASQDPNRRPSCEILPGESLNSEQMFER